MPIRWKLAELLERKQMTGYQLAAATGISRQTIYKLLRTPGVARVNGETLSTLCRVLKCQPSALLEYVADKK